MKVTTFTHTVKGVIDHMKHPTLGFLMPVKLETVRGKVSLIDKKPTPVMHGDKYVYALPAGGFFVA